MGVSLSRRDVLLGRVDTRIRALPPGFIGDRPEVCSDCSICIDHCPTSIIVINEGHLSLDFSQGECTFCGECRTHCPAATDLFDRGERVSHVMRIGNQCLSHSGVDCQACRDYCPVNAIRFRPRRGGPFLPEIVADTCTGCGACVTVCPTAAVSIEQRSEVPNA
jgi:ferredoxin-type protein NapF